MFFRKKEVLGAYVVYSHETAKINPSIIIREYDRLIIKEEECIDELSGFSGDVEFKLFGDSDKCFHIGETSNSVTAYSIVQKYKYIGSVNLGKSKKQLKLYNDFIRGICEKIEANLNEINKIRMRIKGIKSERNEFVLKYWVNL